MCECEGVQSEGGRKKEGGGQIKGMGIYSKNYCIIENFCAGKEVCVFIFSENSILGSGDCLILPVSVGVYCPHFQLFIRALSCFGGIV